MTPYFPKQTEIPAYRCQGCGGWFYPGNMQCCVAHAPGTCCHHYEGNYILDSLGHLGVESFHRLAMTREMRDEIWQQKTLVNRNKCL